MIMINLWKRLWLIGSKKRCTDACFHYDPDGRGCSYNSYDFDAKERVRPGKKCLHPEWDESKLIRISIHDFCNLLASNYTEVD